MEPRITLITLGVRDLERSIAFYRDGLGLPQRAGAGVFFATRGTWLALFGRDDLAHDAGVSPAGTGFAGFSLAHNVRTREEVERQLAQAVAAGGTLVKPAAEAFWGGYHGYFADPDGFLWEIAWNPDFWVE